VVLNTSAFAAALVLGVGEQVGQQHVVLRTLGFVQYPRLTAAIALDAQEPPGESTEWPRQRFLG
jgi:hypothetical protein